MLRMTDSMIWAMWSCYRASSRGKTWPNSCFAKISACTTGDGLEAARDKGQEDQREDWCSTSKEMRPDLGGAVGH